MSRIGNVEFEIEGKKRGFRLGTYAISVAQNKYGASSIEELFRKMGIGSANGVGDTHAVLCLFYGAAVHYYEHKFGDHEKDFVIADVSDWMDEIGIERTTEIFSELLRVYQSKNYRPPVNPGDLKKQQ